MSLPGILGGFETLQKQFFNIFGAKEKTGKISDFSDFSVKNQRFFSIFCRFFLSKSFPCRRKTDFSPINWSKNPIFCSLVTTSSNYLEIIALYEAL